MNRFCFKVFVFSILLFAFPATTLMAQQDQVPANPITAIRVRQDQKKALKVNVGIFQAVGVGNTFMVTTREGNVIIDTSMPYLLKLAGGAEAVAKLAMERAQANQSVEALRLVDIVLAADAKNQTALQAKLKTLETLRERCCNSNERGWLDFSISQIKTKLGEKK